MSSSAVGEWPEPSSSWKAPYLYLKIVAEWKSLEFISPLEPSVPGKEINQCGTRIWK
jgi:hypothetical protein